MPDAVRIEPIDYRHDAAFHASDTEVTDFDAWFGYTPGTDFAGFVRSMQDHAQGLNLPWGHVPATFMLALVGDRVVGRVSIRHLLTEPLFYFGGNIGYYVIAADRGNGYATEMLRQALVYCRVTLGLDRALVTCDESNLASRRVIEKNGGQLEDIRPVPDSELRRMRFWFFLGRQ